MKFSSFRRSGTFVNPRKLLCFAFLFGLSLISRTSAECDDNHCCKNSDCEEKFGNVKPYCNEGGGGNCRCEKTRWQNRKNTGQCESLLPNGQKAYEGGDYNSCAYKNGICGYCGPQAKDYGPCSENKDCPSKWCDAQGNCKGKCKPKVKNGYKAINGDYNSCEATGHGHCGYCGYGNDVGKPCGENSDCKSGWCNGKGFETANCGGTCEAKRADGEKAFERDYNSCKSGEGHCGYCGPANSEGQSCTGNGDCADGLFCGGIDLSLTGCTGTCMPLIDDNKECPIDKTTLNGNNSACKSPKCVDYRKKIAYCQPVGGFLPPMPCTQDIDCSQAGHGNWCLNGTASIGQCAACPDTCEGGCHACNDDQSKLSCGSSSELDKIGCSVTVIGGAIGDLFKCLYADEDRLDCAQEIGGELDGDGVFQIGEECLNMELVNLEIEKEFLEDDEDRFLSVSGGMQVGLDIDLRVDINQWQFELNVTSTVENQLGVNMAASAGWEREYEKRITRKQQMLKMVVMAGVVPILIEIDAEGMVWFDAEAMAGVSADISLSGKSVNTHSFLIDIDDKVANATKSSGKDSKPFGIDNIVVEGTLSASASLRVGPRITVSVEKVPLYLDVAARLGANVELTASKELDGTACVSGDLGFNGGLDVRAGIEFPSVGVAEFADQICSAGVAELVEKINPVGKIIDRGQCYADLLGIDTTKIDEKQEEISDKLDEASNKVCDEVRKRLDENEKFSHQSGDNVLLSTEWASIIDVDINVEKGLCANVGVVPLLREEDVYTEIGSMEPPRSDGDGYCEIAPASFGPACMKLLYQNSMFVERNGYPAHSGFSDTPSNPTAFEFISTGYVNEYLIRKYGEDKYLTYESPDEPSYVSYKTKSISEAMDDVAFHFNVLLDGSYCIRHVVTGMYLQIGRENGRRWSNISFQNRTSVNENYWNFKHLIVECEVGEPFEYNNINHYGKYDKIEFPKDVDYCDFSNIGNPDNLSPINPPQPVGDTNLGPACIKMYYQKNIVYEKNGNPAFTGNEDTTTPPTAFEFIPTGNLNEYLIRKYDENKFLTYKSPSQPSYVEFKSKSLSDAMSDGAFHFKLWFDSPNLEFIQHVETGLYLSRDSSESNIIFRALTPDNEDEWWFKLNIVECELGQPFERNEINTYGVYDEIEFP